MEHINLNAVTQLPKTGHTSKGDQPKWQVHEKWYKADHMGYEALAETVVSGLLALSSVQDFVPYLPILIQYQNQELSGCVSDNFRGKDEMLVPLERLHRAYQGRGLAAALASFQTASERMKYTVDFVEKATGLTEVGAYLTTILELDAFFLNEDRHTNNLAVIRNEKTGQFRLCPIFDNGLALLSDLNDYPLDADIYNCINRIQAKPFAQRFDEQIEEANELYGSYLKFSFQRQDVTRLLSAAEELYPEPVLKRVEKILFEQMRRYGIYF